MSPVNAVQMFSLVCVFTAACQAKDDVCRISCDNVSGTVGTEVNFTCSVSQNCSECCVKMYKFQFIEKNGSDICRQDPNGSCDKRNNFTCSFTPTTAMEEQFRFVLQTLCGLEKAEFTVNIIDEEPGSTDPVFQKDDTTSAVVSSIIIILIIIILMAIYFKKHPPGFVQQKRFQCIRQDEDKPENTVDSTV